MCKKLFEIYSLKDKTLDILVEFLIGCLQRGLCSISVYCTSQWFSPGHPLSSTNKTDRHDITEILLKVALSTIKQTNNLLGFAVHKTSDTRRLYTSGRCIKERFISTHLYMQLMHWLHDNIYSFFSVNLL
jgi:hypothetical protein